MKVKRFEWEGVNPTRAAVRIWGFEGGPNVREDVRAILREYLRHDDKDEFLSELTERFDATDEPPESLRVNDTERSEALSRIDRDLRESLELASTNIRKVAEAQLQTKSQAEILPQGQEVTIREVPVSDAGIYAPGGRAAYPSSVLMCAIPARVAGVQRIVLTTPPGADGKVNPAVLAAAALCEVEEVYAVGGAQAIFALAYGSQTIRPVFVVAGPGNAWVREAKRHVSGFVAIDSLAGPSELMAIIDSSTNLRWMALDLCAQAEHGDETPLVLVASDDGLLDKAALEVKRSAASRSGVAKAKLALVKAPTIDAAIEFANSYAPEHLQLMVEDAKSLAKQVNTAGCVFCGNHSATSFGDYVAGSNHVLPTDRAGTFSGPLGPGAFRRKIATVEVSAEAAAKLAPHVDTIARAEGFPVHGESAMIRTEK
jgi:histidinol dehydrogenase